MKVVAGEMPRLARLIVAGGGHPAGGRRRRHRAGADRTVRRAAAAERAAARGRRRARLDFRQAGGILSRALGRDSRRQGRRHRGLDPVRHRLPLRHLPRGRSRPRQGGDLVLRGRQRGDLEARRGAVVRLRDVAGDGRGGDRGHCGGDAQRHRADHEQRGALDRDRELRAHHSDRRAPALGERPRVPARAATLYRAGARSAPPSTPAHT